MDYERRDSAPTTDRGVLKRLRDNRRKTGERKSFVDPNLDQRGTERLWFSGMLRLLVTGAIYGLASSPLTEPARQRVGEVLARVF